MPKHLPTEINAKRKTCPLDGSHGIHESVEVSGWDANHVTYETPRLCLEWLGIDVGDLHYGIYWFNAEQAKKARAHHHTRRAA